MSADTFTGRRQGLFMVRSALTGVVRHKQNEAWQCRLALFRLCGAIREIREIKEIVEITAAESAPEWGAW